MTEAEVKTIVKEAVEETLTAIGLDISSVEAKIERQKDNDWVRSRRQLEEKISWKLLVLILTTAVGGVLSIFILGFKTLFLKS